MILRLRSLPLLVLGLCFAVAMLASPAYAQTTGSLDESFNPEVTGGYVRAMAVQPDRKIIIGGDFYSVAGSTRPFLARLNPEGILDREFSPQVDSTVRCVAVLPDGKILIGGDFGGVGNRPRLGLARLNPNGSIDQSFDCQLDNTVRCIAVQRDGKILVGGLFTKVGQTSRPYFIRLNADGTLDTGFNTGVGGQVWCTAVQPDGKILIGGAFTTVGGRSQPGSARLEANGALDPTFTPSVGGYVTCISGTGLDTIRIAGSFTQVEGGDDKRIVQLFMDGSEDSSFNCSFNDDVHTLVEQADGMILAGGDFTAVNGTSVGRVARIHPNGALDTNFTPVFHSVPVFSLAVQADGKVLISGNYYTALGTAPKELTRFYTGEATQSLTVEGPNQVSWIRGGSSPKATVTTLEHSNDGGGTWVPVDNGIGLPTHGILRARAYTPGGTYGGSMGIVESRKAFAFIPVPSVTTGGIIGLPPNSATLQATVNPNGYQTEVWFEYGHTTAYGQSTAPQILENPSSGEMAVSQFVTGLERNRTYHFRIVARNEKGTVYGFDQEFITPNSLPVPMDDTFHLELTGEVGSSYTLNVLTNDSDPDGDSLGISGIKYPTANTVKFGPNGTLLFTPGQAFDGNASFTYTVNDGYGGKATATVTFTNALPVGGDDQYHLPAGTDPQTLAVLSNDTDSDGDVLTITGVTQGAKGSVNTDGSTVTYTPAAEFVGDDSFTYTVSDRHGGFTTATVTLTNASPVANPDTVAVLREPVTINVLANDSDSDGDTLMITEVSMAWRGQVTTDGTSITYTPHGLFKNDDSFSYVVSDGRGKTAVGFVKIVLAQPVSDYVAARGAQVFGLPEGTGFVRFGVPSMSDNGQTAFVATLKQGKGPVVEALFSGFGPMFVTKAGNDAPGIAGGKFRDFKDPVLSSEGHLAFIASVSGVPKNTASGIWTRRTGDFTLLVQAGAEAPGTSGAMFSRFDSLAVPDTGRVVFVAGLARGIGDVTDRNDLGVWAENEDGTLRMVVREQDKVLIGEEERTVKTISAFAALCGSAGQRRGFNVEGDLLLRLGFVEGGKALVRVTKEGAFHEMAVEGGTTEELTDAKFSGFGLGTLSEEGTALFRATLKHVKGVVAGHNDEVILWGKESGNLRLVARTGSPVPDIVEAVFKSLQDPVGNAEGGIAFIGSMVPGKGGVTGKNDVAIWVSDEEGEPSILVREGDEAPGVEGRKFAEFKSLAFPDSRGVALVASLAPKGGSPRVMGLWAQDSDGNLQLLLREGQKLRVNGVEKPIKKFTVLSAVASAPSQGGSYSENGGFAYRATFADGTEGVFTVWVP